VSHTLSRWQAVVLGLVVLAATAAGGAGLVAVAAKQGLWADTFDLAVGLPEAHDVTPGTPVRVRGVDAGQVVAVEYPATDGPDAAVTVRLRLDAKFRGRLFADATAQVQPTGLLGGKVVNVRPGTPAAGPAGDTLRALPAADVTAAADKLAAVADEADQLLKGVRAGRGTLGKLVTDESLYDEVRGVVRRADSELAGVGPLVTDGRAAVQSVQRTTEAFERSRLGRQFVDNPTAALVRPDCRRDERAWLADALFEPGTAILTDNGRFHLGPAVEWLKAADPRAEAAVAAAVDPNDPKCPPGAAGEITRKRAEAVAEYLKGQKAHKIGWFSRRTITPIGLGYGPHPAVAPEHPLPPAYVQVLLFTPQ
jgi:hypothetical protein